MKTKPKKTKSKKSVARKATSTTSFTFTMPVTLHSKLLAKAKKQKKSAAACLRDSI